MKSFKSQGACLLFVLTLLAFAVPALQLEWQGIGNMTESNITQVRTFINQNPLPTNGISANLDNVAQNISTQLNDLWNPAWNVVVYSFSSNVDAVLYGYAFRGHWMWFNGLPNPVNSGLFMSYIIWKDFNCIEWRRLNSTSIGFTSE